VVAAGRESPASLSDSARTPAPPSFTLPADSVAEPGLDGALVLSDATGMRPQVIEQGALAGDALISWYATSAAQPETSTYLRIMASNLEPTGVIQTTVGRYVVTIDGNATDEQLLAAAQNLEPGQLPGRFEVDVAGLPPGVGPIGTGFAVSDFATTDGAQDNDDMIKTIFVDDERRSIFYLATRSNSASLNTHRLGFDSVTDTTVRDQPGFIRTLENQPNYLGLVWQEDGTGGITAVPGGSSGPWRGNFFTPPFEGSMRVPAIIRWPDRIPAGRVTQEILAAYDWLPTLAAMIGRSDLVPTDRPIDGVDASDFLLGDDETTGRKVVLFHGPDGELMSAKWRGIKVVFRYSEGIDQPIVTPQLPLVYDLESDPGEQINLLSAKLDMGWMFAPALHHVGEFNKTVEQYPNIAPGADFDGY
jgi:hypothetical protein